MLCPCYLHSSPKLMSLEEECREKTPLICAIRTLPLVCSVAPTRISHTHSLCTVAPFFTRHTLVLPTLIFLLKKFGHPDRESNSRPSVLIASILPMCHTGSLWRERENTGIYIMRLAFRLHVCRSANMLIIY